MGRGCPILDAQLPIHEGIRILGGFELQVSAVYDFNLGV